MTPTTLRTPTLLAAFTLLAGGAPLSGQVSTSTESRHDSAHTEFDGRVPGGGTLSVGGGHEAAATWGSGGLSWQSAMSTPGAEAEAEPQLGASFWEIVGDETAVASGAGDGEELAGAAEEDLVVQRTADAEDAQKDSAPARLHQGGDTRDAQLRGILEQIAEADGSAVGASSLEPSHSNPMPSGEGEAGSKLARLDAIARGEELSEVEKEARGGQQEHEPSHPTPSPAAAPSHPQSESATEIAGAGQETQDGHLQNKEKPLGEDSAVSSKAAPGGLDHDEGGGGEEGVGTFSLDLEEGGQASMADRFARALLSHPDLKKAKLAAEAACGGFALEYYMDEEGGVAGGISPWGGEGTLVFVVVASERQRRGAGERGCKSSCGGAREGIAVGACDGGGGISPDSYRELRATLFREVGEANSDLALGGILTVAERLASLEIQSLDRAIKFAEKKAESGTSAVAPIFALRTQMAAAEVDRGHLRAEGRAARVKFEERAQIPFEEAWSEVDSWAALGKFSEGTEYDIDFGSIFRLVAQVAVDNDSGGKLMQELAGGVTGGKHLLSERAGVSSLADEALRKTRSAMDEGRMDEGEVAAGQALLMRTQRAEMVALARLASAEARAYPPVALKVLPQGGESEGCGLHLPSWLPVAAATGAVVALFFATMVALGRRRGAA